MASEIKTRIARKDIKAIDKAATIAQHMKHSSVQIKERAEQTQEQREHSPVEYAQGRIADNAERVSRGAAAQVKNQSGKAVKHVKEKQRLKREEKQIRKELREGRIPEQGERPSFSPSGGEKGYQPKEQMIKTAQSQAARKRAAENSRKHLQKKTAQIVRTVERRERDIYPSGRKGGQVCRKRQRENSRAFREDSGADRQNYGKNHGTGGKERIQGSESITEGG